MIGGLLEKKAKGRKSSKTENETIEQVNDIFSRAAPEIKMHEEPDIEVDEGDENPLVDDKLSTLQLKERMERTIFIGNVAMELKKREILAKFRPYGKVDRFWRNDGYLGLCEYFLAL